MVEIFSTAVIIYVVIAVIIAKIFTDVIKYTQEKNPINYSMMYAHRLSITIFITCCCVLWPIFLIALFFVEPNNGNDSDNLY
jgi:hypothetical protein